MAPHTFRRAIEEIRDMRDQIDPALRAAAARSIAGRQVPEVLLEIFAGDNLEVAAPLVSLAPPSDMLREAASEEVRRFLEAMYPLPKLGFSERGSEDDSPEALPLDRELSEPTLLADAELPVAVSSSAPAAPVLEELPSISELVARIEQLGRSREGPVGTLASETKPQPLPSRALENVRTPVQQSAARVDSPALFRWECGPGGNIAWVDGVPRGPLIGRSIARAEAKAEGVDEEVERAFARRLPFRDASLSLPDAGAVAGEWLISGVPAFAPADGRFVGFRGVARRAEALRPSTLPNTPALADAASLRELVHEIKTPLNAIIGFAEIIEGQYLGPAQSGYRARAAEIVEQARVLLGATDDLDLAARARGAGHTNATAIDLASFFERLAARIHSEAAARGVKLIVDAHPTKGMCALDRSLAERLLIRFAGSLLSAAEPGEVLRLSLRSEAGSCIFRMSRPEALQGLAPEALESAAQNEAAQVTSLRLLAGLVRIVGGSLSTEGADLSLHIPTSG